MLTAPIIIAFPCYYGCHFMYKANSVKPLPQQVTAHQWQTSEWSNLSMPKQVWMPTCDFCKKCEVVLWDIQQPLCYHKCFFVLSRKLDSKWKLTQANSNARIPIHQSNFYVTNPEKSLYCYFLEVPLIVYA